MFVLEIVQNPKVTSSDKNANIQASAYPSFCNM